MTIGARGLAIVKKWEQLRPAPYKDAAGYWTIGWGHKLKAGESLGQITEEDADDLLQADLLETEMAVEDMALPARESEYDALVSLTFNIGAGSLKGSTLLELHKRGDRLDTAMQFGRWHFSGGKPRRGLMRRRLEEAALYLEDA